MILRILACSFAMGFCFSTTQGQQLSDSTVVEFLDEVVVSDSRYALKREHSGKTVIKIDADQIARNRGRTLMELLNLTAGLELSGSRGRPGEIVGVFARGGRGRQVVIIMDGVRVTDPSSFSQEFDLRLLDLSNIASIEIIKGAASTLYGANAATAVINITSKTPGRSAVSGVFQSSIGSQQTAKQQPYNISDIRNNVRISGSPGLWNYGLAFNHHYSNGLSSIISSGNEKDPNSLFGTNLSIGFLPDDNTEIRMYANFNKLNTEYDESFGLVDAPYRFLSQQQRLGFSARLGYGLGSVVLNAAYSDYESENFSAFPGIFKGRNTVLDLNNKIIIADQIHTVLGLNYMHEVAQLNPEAEYKLLDPYLNLVYTGNKGFNLNTGIRLNTHSEYGNQWVYALNPSYLLKRGSTGIKFLASYATSYITPSLSQLFGQFGANANLEPENNRTIEGGVEYFLGSTLRASVVYFNRREENFVFFDNQTFTYKNADGTVDAQGFEVEVFWNLNRIFDAQANYSFTERKGDTAIRIPKHKAYANLSCQFTESNTLTIDFAYTGKRLDTDFTTFTDVELDSFSLLGLAYTQELLPDRAQAFLRVENLLNSDYTEVLGFTTRGRNILLGIQVSF